MSETFNTVTCFSLTTLLLVSLANLVLLILVILESRKKCESSEDYRFGELHGVSKSSLINGNVAVNDGNFMAALVLLKGSTMSLICGTVIISKSWVLTAAHCCQLVKTHPFEKLKLSSNSDNWRKGKKHSVENLVHHINFTSKGSSFDICLIRSGSPFTGAKEKSISLASSSYQYTADTSATTLGWNSRKGSISNNLYSINVNLIAFQRCQTLVKNERVDETMVCAYNIDNNDCKFDSGGPLIQNNIIVGIVSFETNCAKRSTVRVFTRIAVFEKWFEMVELQNDVKIGAVFRS